MPNSFVHIPKPKPKVTKNKIRVVNTTRKSLECLLCFRRYSLEDIKDGLYRIETGVCSFCYAELQKKSHNEACFGKPSVRLPEGKTLLGYNSKAVECNRLCQDRELCRSIVLHKHV